MGSKTNITTYLFFQRGQSRISGIIAWVTGPWKWMFSKKKRSTVPSHVGVMFDVDGVRTCYEAHMKIPGKKSGGWHGPFDYEKLTDWKCAMLQRHLWIVELDLSEEDSVCIMADAKRQVGHLDYAKGQLGFLYLWRRFHIPIPSSPNKIVCSEGSGRILDPYFDLAEAADVKNFERLTPWNIFYGLKNDGYKVEEVECPFP